MRRPSLQSLEEAGLPAVAARLLRDRLDHVDGLGAVEAWRRISQEILSPSVPFEVHRLLYDGVFHDWDVRKGPPPAWTPQPEDIDRANLGRLVRERGFTSLEAFRGWCSAHRAEFWELMIERLPIHLRKPYERILDPSGGPAAARWLPGASLNIAESCFTGKPGNAAAVIHQVQGRPPATVTYDELQSLSNRVATSLRDMGFVPGDRIAIAMPMTLEAVAIYLGIVKLGAAVVSIADSLGPDEIATRLQIGGAQAVFTQDHVLRGSQRLALYERLVSASGPRAVVLPAEESLSVTLRPGDRAWSEFLSDDDEFDAAPCSPDQVSNVLFSSGTTGDPKAIPWTHTTPIKCGADAFLYHDTKPGDVLAWPTNLGWMMGPWLIYASLMNRATIALYDGAPTTRGFGVFVQDARVNMLGVVPSLVGSWRRSGCLEGLDWSSIKAFSSTGECSNPTDMLFLMSRARYRPIIEYCGGTEIGGGYICGSLVQPASPSTFSTPALGLELHVLDESGGSSTSGEVFLVPPSVGLSTHLLNEDHHEIYYDGVPRGPRGEMLRRHGDQMECLSGGYFKALGRADDTMNLGGIKVGSAEIERVVKGFAGIRDSAAVAVPPPGGGPSRLVVYAVMATDEIDRPESLRDAVAERIRGQLNRLFRLHDVVIVAELPRTASNKVMRRELRQMYLASE